MQALKLCNQQGVIRLVGGGESNRNQVASSFLTDHQFRVLSNSSTIDELKTSVIIRDNEVLYEESTSIRNWLFEDTHEQ